jgi:hypothetical protein
VARNCGTTAFAAARPLAWQGQAEQAALAQAQYLQQNNLFSHTGAGGSSVGDRLTATGYVWSTVGENLAAGFTGTLPTSTSANTSNVPEGYTRHEAELPAQDKAFIKIEATTP